MTDMLEQATGIRNYAEQGQQCVGKQVKLQPTVAGTE